MPERLIIVNTSPLLYLNLVDHLWVLQRLYSNVCIPPAVVAELEAGAGHGVEVPDVRSMPWIHVRAVAAPSLIPAVTDLGAGETEVIALGLEISGSLLVLDDRLARRIADLNGLTYTGTLGVLIRAKREGYLPSIIEVMTLMRTRGMWLSDDIVRAAARLANEKMT